MKFKRVSYNKEPAAKNEILNKIRKIRQELKELKESIKNDMFIKTTPEERIKIRELFKKKYTDYDNLIQVEDYEIPKELRDNEYLYECMETQALISRITNKIQREEAKLLKEISEEIKKDSEKIKKDSDEIRKENLRLKDSIITISSLVFMAFTFIQINFVAFQNSKDYLVVDRLILFSAINIFIIVGIICIVLMIQTLISGEIPENKIDYVLKKISIAFLIFIVIFFVSLYIKNSSEENPEIKKLKNEIISKNEEVTQLNQKIVKLNQNLIDITKMINKLDEKENQLERKILIIDKNFNEKEIKNSEFLFQIKKEKKELQKIIVEKNKVSQI